MKAVILAGGNESHLYALSKVCHKPLLPIANIPILQHTMDYLFNSGVKEIFVTASEGSKEIQNFLEEEERLGMNIHYCGEQTPKGTAGCLYGIRSHFRDDSPFLVMHGSLFMEMDLSEIYRFHKDRGASLTICTVRQKQTPTRIEGLKVLPNGEVEGFHMLHHSKNRRTVCKAVGLYVFNPEVLDMMRPNGFFDIKEQLIPLLRKAGKRICAYEVQGYVKEIDSLEDYFELNHEFIGRLRRPASYGNGCKEILPNVWIDKHANISKDAYLLGPILIGSHAVVEAGAQIVGPAVIGNDCHISKNCLVRNTIIWSGGYTSRGSSIENSVVTKGCVIAENRELKDSLVVGNGFTSGNLRLASKTFQVQTVSKPVSVHLRFPRHAIYHLSKRCLDLVCSALGLVFLSPLFLLIGIAIKMGSKGPVFFYQKRCGKGGKEFQMIKFRTMVRKAEDMKEQLETQKDTDGPVFKMVNDPRVTRVGKILRRTSLDEFPQLMNILKGEMSLVGPRPLSMDEMKFSPSWRDMRLKVKPGLTGLWQVKGRSETPFHDWIQYDVYYAKNQSFWMDIKILLQTVKVVLKKAGAY